jgi:3-hydroxybutyryl-CoA dehydrogenase
VTVVESLGAVAEAPQIVVESIPEDLDLKVAVLSEIAGAFPDAVVASNTSSISITRLGAALAIPERVIGTHYWNPPLLMPLVEIVSGDETDPAVAAFLHRVLAAMSKEPVPVNRDVPGFVWNRLQLALLREVLWLVEHDVTTPQAIDRVVRAGLARRYRYCGPFETIALGGEQAWSAVAANLFPELSSATAAPDLRRWLDGMTADLDALARARDAGLAAELRDEQ